MKRRARAVVTAEQAAAMTFDAWPQAAAAVGDSASWMKRSADAWPTIALALGWLKFNDAELEAAVLRSDPEAWVELMECAGRQQVAYAALAKMLGAAHARLMVALTRRAVREGVA